MAIGYSLKEGLMASAGGILLGLATAFHYTYYNRVTGASGIVDKVFGKETQAWHIAFLGGLFQMSYIYYIAQDGLTLYEVPYYFFIIAGLLVGFGTRLGNGCTSGHGICGLARLRVRSFVSVGVFLFTAVLVANLTHYDQTYEFNMDQNSEYMWLRANPYLGWTIFAFIGIAVLKELFHILQVNSDNNQPLIELISLYAIGATFGIGLCLGGMIDNGVVLNFLTFNDDWNPSLMFVLGFSVMTFGSVYWYQYFSKRNSREVVISNEEAAAGSEGVANTLVATEDNNNEGGKEGKFNELEGGEETLKTGESVANLKESNSAKDVANGVIDAKLIIGAVCFGAGWGLAGICPAPAITIMSIPACTCLFIPALFVGMKSANLLMAMENNST
jgi:uncharacterized protein